MKIQMQKTSFILAVFLAAVLVGVLASLSMRSGPASKETFMQQPTGAPVNGPGIGPYDGVFLPGVASGWLATENIPVGTSVASASAHPLHLLGNTSSPSCCGNSIISSDTGCVCLTAQDQKLFESRGGNRSLA